MRLWHRFIYPITSHFRTRRIVQLRKLLPELFDDTEIRILDLGGSRHFWSHVPIDLKVKHVEIFNISNDEVGEGVGRAVNIPVHVYDGLSVPRADFSYDLVFCNSVLEHVPLGIRGKVAKEIRRLGRAYCVQVPSLCFPIEPHFILPFIHWLPRRIAVYLVFISPWFWLSRPTVVKAKSYFEEVSLLSVRELECLFPDSRIHKERFMGLSKSNIVIGRNFIGV